MWVAGDMMFIAIMGLLVYRWMRESEEAAARTDAREDRLVEQRLAAVLDKRPEPR
jgi:hypothetical protein